MLRVLGARPVYLVPDAPLFRGVHARDGRRRASRRIQLAERAPVASIATGNVTLFPKVNTLVVNAERSRR